MDLYKLKLDQFSTYNGFNLPQDFKPSLTLSNNPEVYFLFCTSFEDVNRYTNMVLSRQIHTKNRIFYIYHKGNKQFHRDHVAIYIKKAPFLQRKAPMLCSLDDTYSCFSCMIQK